MQPPDLTEPGERLSAPEREALPAALARLARPHRPRSVRCAEVVVTLGQTSSTLHTQGENDG
ncbi:hypothetical protein [Nocardiopsis synnemataformans]|uniref:hypothetical protein n=1 Tax=Nocardiopsis synnemataformans TaxID=61305 RepID=UPI003EB95F00